MQVVLLIETLPESGLEASALLHSHYLAKARELLDRPGTTALAIALPGAGPDHDDWRRTLARDLARAYTPRRVNVIGSSDDPTREALLAYLRDAPGVTGQYLAGQQRESHEREDRE